MTLGITKTKYQLFLSGHNHGFSIALNLALLDKRTPSIEIHGRGTWDRIHWTKIG